MRRFPPPWTVEKIAGGLVVRDANGQALAYLYTRENPNDAHMAKVLTEDEAKRIASNIAKLPSLLGRKLNASASVGPFSVTKHNECAFNQRVCKAQRKRRNAMKGLVSMLALAVALAFTGSALAADVMTAKTKADCQKAGGMWNGKTKMCEQKKM